MAKCCQTRALLIVSIWHILYTESVAQNKPAHPRLNLPSIGHFYNGLHKSADDSFRSECAYAQPHLEIHFPHMAYHACMQIKDYTDYSTCIKTCYSGIGSYACELITVRIRPITYHNS